MLHGGEETKKENRKHGGLMLVPRWRVYVMCKVCWVVHVHFEESLAGAITSGHH